MLQEHGVSVILKKPTINTAPEKSLIKAVPEKPIVTVPE